MISMRFGFRRREGFLLLEVVLGITVFGLFLAAVGLVLLRGQENNVVAGDRVRATQAAERALEASRSIRDGSFASLTAGTHGVALNASNMWAFSGSKVTVSGGYVTALAVTSLASDWRGLSVSTKWKHGFNRSGSVLLVSELTDWRSTRLTGDWSSVTLDGSYVDAGTPLFNAVAVSGNYAFAAGSDASGGAGLYVFDISNTAAPSRVASSFTLGGTAYAVAVRGHVLYVGTNIAAGEVRAYDITSPPSFSASNLLSSYNLSGSRLAMGLALTDGNRLVVGADANASYPELYSFDVSATGSIAPLASLEIGSNVNAVAASGTGISLGTADAAAEMKRLRLTATGGLAVLPNGNYNVTSTEAGASVAAAGTSALLGRVRGAIQEMVLFDTRTGGGSPPPSPGPWYHEASGSVLGLQLDPSGCYAFLAAYTSGKAFQVVEAHDKTLPELATYNSANGPGRGLFYDAARDRAFLVTSKALLILKPGAAPGPCS